MEEELKKLKAVYEELSAKLTAKWPEGVENLKGKYYTISVRDLAVAGTLEMVAIDLNKIIEMESDDRK